MDDLGKSIPAAEGMVDAEQSGTPKGHNEFCLNCGTKLTDRFCSHCGQKDIPRRQTLGELLLNFISSFWSYEGKFFLTTKYLITKPGFLATQYNEGKRESFYHPARMYVFISFVFFLLFISLPDKEKDKIQLTEQDKKEIRESTGKLKDGNLDSLLGTIPEKDATLKNVFAQSMDSVKKRASKDKKGKKKGWNFSLDKTEYKSIRAYDSSQLAKSEKDRDGWMKRRMIQRAIELNQRYGEQDGKFSEDFGRAFNDNFSKVLFYLLPIFALLLKILYIRRDFFYSEHLVFSIYYYNFFYLAGSIRMLINLIPSIDWIGSLIGFWIFFYLLFAMKRMYQQGWGKTILKFFLFTFSFFLFVTLGLAINAMAILMVL